MPCSCPTVLYRATLLLCDLGSPGIIIRHRALRGERPLRGPGMIVIGRGFWRLRNIRSLRSSAPSVGESPQQDHIFSPPSFNNSQFRRPREPLNLELALGHKHRATHGQSVTPQSSPSHHELHCQDDKNIVILLLNLLLLNSVVTVSPSSLQGPFQPEAESVNALTARCTLRRGCV